MYCTQVAVVVENAEKLVSAVILFLLFTHLKPVL